MQRNSVRAVVDERQFGGTLPLRCYSGSDTKAVNFDDAEKARVFSTFFGAGQPMWETMRLLAVDALTTPPKTILDVGTGPGEPACHFAAHFSSSEILATDVAASMIDLAKNRASSKGLGERVQAQVVDAADLSPIDTSSFDLIISQMAYMFVEDKAKAFQEAYRVLNPGGIMVVNVWVDFDLIRLAGGLMTAVTGPKDPPPPNPVGPLSLADATVLDALLRDAGFEPAVGHNRQETLTFSLGNIDEEDAFKMAALPVWDVLTEFETSGTFPDAWKTARSAWEETAEPFMDSKKDVYIDGTYRVAVVQKPL